MVSQLNRQVDEPTFLAIKGPTFPLLYTHHFGREELLVLSVPFFRVERKREWSEVLGDSQALEGEFEACLELLSTL